MHERLKRHSGLKAAGLELVSGRESRVGVDRAGITVFRDIKFLAAGPARQHSS
jgi:hypothetical protein